jgi:phosphoglycolate phosphatase
MNLIMFDMDGTIYRTETSFFPAAHDFAGKYGFSQPSNDFLRGFIGQAGEEWKAWLESLHLGKPIDELEQDFDALERHYVDAQGQLYPGVSNVLRTLAADDWHLGICSNAPPWYPELILTNAGVRGLFDLVRLPKRSGETKPMMLRDVWNEIHPERCAMVGDRADDMQAARAGGFFAIGAAYGWAPEELGLADIRINDIAEVPTVLAHHWSRQRRAAVK